MRALIACVVATASLYAQSPTSGDIAYDLTTPTGVIAGTLRMPVDRQFFAMSAGTVPVVLIIAGSGPTDRNGNSGAQLTGNSYLMLADALAQRGIATVRYDKRGIAASRAAGPPEANMRLETSIDDASMWIEKLRNDARFKSVIVAGHGEGSLAGMIAARQARADGFVSIAGVASRASDALPVQLAKESAMLTRPVLILQGTTDTHVGVDEAKAIASYVNGLSLPPHTNGERKSPRAVVSAEVGGVRIAVEYGQLGVRDRKIWGALVPWNRQWMAGADEATTLTTSAPIVLGGLTIPAGDHTLFAMPSADNFQLIVNNETYQFHTDYHASRDLGRVKMALKKLDQPVELLRFEIVKTATGGTLKFAWADREYSVPFTVPSPGSTFPETPLPTSR